MRERRGVPRVLELAKHLGVAEDLARVVAREVEEPPQQSGFVDARQQEHVAGDGGLDERVQNVPAPAIVIFDEARRPRVPAKGDVVVQGEAESVAHLRIRPMGHLEHLEAPREALGEAACDEQGRRASTGRPRQAA